MDGRGTRCRSAISVSRASTTKRRFRHSKSIGAWPRHRILRRAGSTLPAIAPSLSSAGDWCPPGRRTSGWVRASSTPGRRPSTPSHHTAQPSAHVGAWCRPTDGSSGSGPGTASNPFSWRLWADRPCRSPLCERVGIGVENPSSPSPSSRRRRARSLPTFTTDSRRSSIRISSTTGSIRLRRRHDSSTWCVNPTAALTSGGPSAPE